MAFERLRDPGDPFGPERLELGRLAKPADAGGEVQAVLHLRFPPRAFCFQLRLERDPSLLDRLEPGRLADVLPLLVADACTAADRRTETAPVEAGEVLDDACIVVHEENGPVTGLFEGAEFVRARRNAVQPVRRTRQNRRTEFVQTLLHSS